MSKAVLLLEFLEPVLVNGLDWALGTTSTCEESSCLALELIIVDHDPFPLLISDPV